MNLRFLKHQHLRRPIDFRSVYDLRMGASDAWLNMQVKPNGLAYSRVGFSVSRRYGNAVRRNRLRRLYRESFRLSQHDLPMGLDIILIPRSANEPTLAIVQNSLQALANRLSRRLSKEKPCSEPG